MAINFHRMMTSSSAKVILSDGIGDSFQPSFIKNLNLKPIKNLGLELLGFFNLCHPRPHPTVSIALPRLKHKLKPGFVSSKRIMINGLKKSMIAQSAFILHSEHLMQFDLIWMMPEPWLKHMDYTLAH